MTDLFDSETVQAFKNAIRDVTDTFQKHPVVLRQEAGDTQLNAGLKIITAEVQAKEGGEEIEEAYLVSFNREYLEEMGLVDVGGELLITYDDQVVINLDVFEIIKIHDTAVFRDEKLMVKLEVIR